MADLVSRYKVTFASVEDAERVAPRVPGAAPSRVRYVYGEDHLMLKFLGVEVENAGSYDRETNDCDFTEPVEYFEGRIAPGK